MNANSLRAWSARGLVLLVGGMIFVLLLLLTLFGAARLLTGTFLLEETGIAVVALLLASIVAGLCAYAALRFLLRWDKGATLATIALWLVGYLLLWALSAAFETLTLPVFLIFWLLLSAAAAALWQPMSKTLAASMRPPPPPPTSAQAMPGLGRITVATYGLIREHVRIARQEAANGLPAAAGPALRAETAAAILQRTLQDWVIHNNPGGLTAKDLLDIRSFIELAASVAGNWQAPGAAAVYRATLNALLDDWLHNWNANGVDGPPRRG